MNEAGSVSVKGVALCGIEITDGASQAIGRILSVQGMGASRAAIPATTNNSPNLWAEFIYSCIAAQKPFRITCGFNQNDADWVADMQSAQQEFAIVLPPEEGYDDGAEMTFDGGYTDFEFGGELQTMVMCSITIQPTGKPTVTAGTPTAP